MQEALRFVARPLTFALLAVCLLASGCAAHSHAHPHARPRPAARAVVVATAHHHTPRCGHYLHRGRWYHVHNHVHARGCGHVWVGGVWRLR